MRHSERSDASRRLFVVLYLVLAIGMMVYQIGSHGGIRGDVTYRTNEVHGAPTAVLFNRWALDDDPPLILKLFYIVNLPAALLALAGARGLAYVPGFSGPYPLGLSAASYAWTLLLVLSLVQWYLIGLLLDRYRARSFRGQYEELTSDKAPRRM